MKKAFPAVTTDPVSKKLLGTVGADRASSDLNGNEDVCGDDDDDDGDEEDGTTEY